MSVKKEKKKKNASLYSLKVKRSVSYYKVCLLLPWSEIFEKVKHFDVI